MAISPGNRAKVHQDCVSFLLDICSDNGHTRTITCSYRGVLHASRKADFFAPIAYLASPSRKGARGDPTQTITVPVSRGRCSSPDLLALVDPFLSDFTHADVAEHITDPG